MIETILEKTVILHPYGRQGVEGPLDFRHWTETASQDSFQYFGRDGSVHQGVLDIVVDQEKVEVYVNDAFQTSVTTEGDNKISAGDSVELKYRTQLTPRKHLEVLEMKVNGVELDLTPMNGVGKPIVTKTGRSQVKQPTASKKELHYVTRKIESGGFEEITVNATVYSAPDLTKKLEIRSHGAKANFSRKVEGLGFVMYRGGPNSHHMTPHLLAPSGTLELLDNRLSQYESSNTTTVLVPVSSREAYVSAKGKRSNNKIKKLPTVNFEGRDYILKDHLDSLLEDVRDLKKTKRTYSHGNLVTYHQEGAKGQVQGGFYGYDGLAVLLLDESNPFVKAFVVKNQITPSGVKNATKSRIERVLRKHTDFRNHYCDEWGNTVPESQKGRGKKHNVPVAVANNALRYLVDHGVGIPIENLTSRYEV